LPFFTPLVRRRGLVNLVHHVHREQWQIIFPGLAGHWGWWVESWLAPRLYRKHPYVTVSEATRRELVGLGVDDDRISVVHNGIDAPHPIPRDIRALTPTICVLGRLVPHKQVEDALAAAAAARTNVPDLRVEIVGEGWWHETLVERTRQLGLSDAVTFHGHLPDDDRDAVLDRSWVLLAPSVKEGWGIAIMEAAAHGVPAVCRDVPGLRDSVRHGETGRHVPAGTSVTDVLHDALTELADPVPAARTAARCRDWAACFDWADTGTRFTAVVERHVVDRAVTGWLPGMPEAVVAEHTPGGPSLVEQCAPPALQHALRARDVEDVTVRAASTTERLLGRATPAPAHPRPRSRS